MLNVWSLVWPGLWTSFGHSICLDIRHHLLPCLDLQCIQQTFSSSHLCSLFSSVTCSLYLVKNLVWHFWGGLQKLKWECYVSSFTLRACFILAPCVVSKTNCKWLPSTSCHGCILPFLFFFFRWMEMMSWLVSDQFLAICKGLQWTLVSCHWAHIRYSALPPTHHFPGTKKRIKLVLFRESFKRTQWNSTCFSGQSIC